MQAATVPDDREHLKYHDRIKLIQAGYKADTGNDLPWREAQGRYRSYMAGDSEDLELNPFPAGWQLWARLWRRNKRAAEAQSQQYAYERMLKLPSKIGADQKKPDVAPVVMHINGEEIPIAHLSPAKWFIRTVGSPEAAMRVLKLLCKDVQ